MGRQAQKRKHDMTAAYMALLFSGTLFAVVVVIAVAVMK